MQKNSNENQKLQQKSLVLTDAALFCRVLSYMLITDESAEIAPPYYGNFHGKIAISGRAEMEESSNEKTTSTRQKSVILELTSYKRSSICKKNPRENQNNYNAQHVTAANLPCTTPMKTFQEFSITDRDTTRKD